MTDRIHKAIIYAGKRHSGQFRKGTLIPYLVHPMEVMGILMENNCPENVIIAGILHDVIEDTCNDDDAVRGEVRREIKMLFGEEVLNIVNGESEDKNKSWKERKQATIDTLKNESKEIQLVCCADKLSNMMSIFSDKEEIGEKIFERFNGTKKDLEWYYKGILKGLDKIKDYKMLEQLNYYICKVFE